MKRGQVGFTLVEILVSSVMITVVILAVTASLRMTNKFFNDVRNKRNRDRVIANTLQNIVQNIGLFQKNYGLTETKRLEMLDKKNLPIAWGQDIVTTKELCPSCPGRMGFVIEPINNVGGLNQLTVRITHDVLIDGYQEYVYILSDD